MIARGFKSVGWVVAVAMSALGCYMLSLNVAAERADLASIERQIIAAKQDIRALQTELGTRGRLTQLEHWNAEVLALSAPAPKQFLQNEFRLASLTEPQRSLAEGVVKVHMASADAVVEQQVARPAVVSGFTGNDSPPSTDPLVRRVSLNVATAPVLDKPAQGKSVLVAKPAPAKSAPAKKTKFIDDDLVQKIGAASSAENKNGGASIQ